MYFNKCWTMGGLLLPLRRFHYHPKHTAAYSAARVRVQKTKTNSPFQFYCALHVPSNTDVDAEELSNAVRSTLDGKPRLSWEESR